MHRVLNLNCFYKVFLVAFQSFNVVVVVGANPSTNANNDGVLIVVIVVVDVLDELDAAIGAATLTLRPSWPALP